MQRPSLTSLRRVGAILAVMLAALVLTTLAVAALDSGKAMVVLERLRLVTPAPVRP